MIPSTIGELYDKYAPVLYGMVIFNVKQQDAATSILLQVFNNIGQSDPGLFRLMRMTKRAVAGYLVTRQPLPVGNDDSTLSNGYILRLAVLGHYTLSDLVTLLYMEESLIRKKIHLGLQEYRGLAVKKAALSY